jgi:hypothetical protein
LLCIALAPQWVAAFLIMHHRPRSPTKVDLAILRYGIILLFALFIQLNPFMEQMTEPRTGPWRHFQSQLRQSIGLKMIR